MRQGGRGRTHQRAVAYKAELMHTVFWSWSKQGDDRQTPNDLGNFTVMSTPPLDLHELCLATCKQLAAAQRELNTRDLRINELESQLQLLAVTQELRALCPLYIQTTYCPPMFH
jgi:hypothetical protein